MGRRTRLTVRVMSARDEDLRALKMVAETIAKALREAGFRVSRRTVVKNRGAGHRAYMSVSVSVSLGGR